MLHDANVEIFAMVVSLSYELGDGANHYTLWSALGENATPPAALNVDRKAGFEARRNRRSFSARAR